MQKRGKTAQDIAKESRRNITVSDIRSFQNGNTFPTPYQVTFLNSIFGIDMELFLNPEPKHQVSVNSFPVARFEVEKVIKAEKPGKTKKPKGVDILKPPKNKECRWCGVDTGTECYRHAEDDTIKYLSGGGIMGGKIPDQFTVWGCDKCDRKYSTKPDKDNYIRQLEHSLRWSTGIIKTWLV
jgi:hypothetical protein